jgi:hypothetical protein
MNQVYFKHNVEDQADKMIISFRLQKQISDTKKLDKNFNFVRALNDPISTTINRIKCNVEKEIKSKSKKKSKKDTQASSSDESQEVIFIRLIIAGSKFNPGFISMNILISKFNPKITYNFRSQSNFCSTTMKFTKKVLKIY